MSELIHYIKNRPYLAKKIDNSEAWQFIKQHLKPFIRDHLYRLYQKDNILFFIFSHPSPKYEFDQKHKADIFSLLKMYEDLKHCQLGITTIKARTSYKYYQQKDQEESEESLQKPITNGRFKERSLGNFNNTLQDRQLFMKLEQIRDIIKHNQNSTQESQELQELIE